MPETTIPQLRVGDGVLLKNIPASVVRAGLDRGWLRYTDEGLSPTGEWKTVDSLAGRDLWDSQAQATQRRLSKWRLHASYFCTVTLLAILIWSTIPYLQDTGGKYEWLDYRPFHRFFITYAYIFWMLTPLLLYAGRLMGIVFPFMVAMSLRPLTGVDFLDMTQKLGLSAFINCLWAVMAGYLAGTIVAFRKEKARHTRPRATIPQGILRAYQEGYIEPPPASTIVEPEPARQHPPVPRQPDPGEPITITLIHGTKLFLFRWFSRKRAWTDPESFVCSAIKQAFPGRTIRFSEFPWSGNNSHASRLKASKRLIAYLRAFRGNLSNHFLLAHSHGGTVASYALREPDLQSKIGGLACIGTPFLLTRAASFRPFRRWIAFLGGAFGFSLMSWMGYGNFHQAFNSVCDFFDVPASDPGAWMCLFFIVVLTLSGLAFLLAPFANRVLNAVRRRAVRAQVNYAELLDTANHPPAPLVCVHDSSDEARRWLRLLNRAVALPDRLAVRVSPVLVIAVTVLVVVAAGYLFQWWPSINTRYEVDWNKLPAGPIRTDYFKYRLLTSTSLGVWISNLVTSTASSVVISVLLLLALALLLFVVTVVTQKMIIGSGFSLGSLSWYEIASSSLIRIHVVARPRNLSSLCCRSHRVSVRHELLGGLNHSAMLASPIVLRHILEWLGEQLGESPSLADLEPQPLTGIAEDATARRERTARARKVVGSLSALLGLITAVRGITLMSDGNLELMQSLELILGTTFATLGCILLAMPWFVRHRDFGRRAFQRCAAIATFLLPLTATAWYATTILPPHVRVVVLTQRGRDKESLSMIHALRDALNPIQVGIRIVSVGSITTISCEAVSAIGTPRNAPVVLWLAPQPTLLHLGRLRPHGYAESGFLENVPEIENRCSQFPPFREDLAIAATRALALLDLGGSAQAAKEFVELARQPDISNYVRFYTGLSLALQHYPEAALRYWDNLPAVPALLNDKAVMYASLNRYDEALRTLTQAIQGAPQNPTLFINRGNLRRLTAAYQEALSDFNEALRLAPDTAPRAYFRGLVLRDNGDEDAAQKHFGRSIDLDTHYPPPYLERYAYYSRHHSFGDDQPYTSIFDLIHLSATDTESLFYKGQAYAIEGRRADALEAYDLILAAEPRFCSARIKRALLMYDETKGKDQSQIRAVKIANLREVAKNQPDCAEADYQLGELLSEQDEAKEALAAYANAIRKNWRTAECHLALGELLRSAGLRDQAIAEFQRALNRGSADTTRAARNYIRCFQMIDELRAKGTIRDPNTGQMIDTREVAFSCQQ